MSGLASGSTAGDRRDVTRIGGILIAASMLLFVCVGLVAVTGGPATLGLRTVGGLLVTSALVALAGGFGLVAIGGLPEIGGRVLRVGLALLAVGIAAVTIAGLISASMLTNPLEDRPFVLAGLTGAFLAVAGAGLSLAGLAIGTGTGRAVLGGLVGGLALVIAGAIASNAWLADHPGEGAPPAYAILIAIAGAGVIGGSIVAFSLIAIRHRQPAPIANVLSP
jgi:hypothetical protein